MRTALAIASSSLNALRTQCAFILCPVMRTLAEETIIKNERGGVNMLKWSCILLLVLFFIVSFSSISIAESPTEKGVYSLSGGIGFTHVEGEGNSYSISPSCLYFVYNNIGIGMSGTYGKSDFEDSTTTTKGIGPAIRWYFPLEQKFFIEASYQYSNTKYETEMSSLDHESTSKVWGYELGADYFISRNVAIEPSLFYRDYDYESNYASGNSYSHSRNYFGFSVGINVFIY